MILKSMDRGGVKKLYVSYRIGNFNWLSINTHSTTLILNFLVKANNFKQSELASDLNIEIFDKEESLSEKFGLPSSVLIQNRNEKSDRIILRLKEEFDLSNDNFKKFMEKSL